MLYRLGDMKQGLWSTGVTKLTGEDGGIGEQISLCYFVYLVGQDSSVDTATHQRLCGSGIDPRWGARFFAPVQTSPEAYPPSYTMDTGSFLGVKGPGHGTHPI